MTRLKAASTLQSTCPFASHETSFIQSEDSYQSFPKMEAKAKLLRSNSHTQKEIFLNTKAKLKAVPVPNVGPKMQVVPTAKLRGAASSEDDRRHLIYEVSKFLVPTWFGQASYEKSIKKPLSAQAAFCLVAVGASSRDTTGECEVGVQIILRPSGFDRQEARDFTEDGFRELRNRKLIVVLSNSAESKERDLQLRLFKLSAEGQRTFDLIQKSMLAPNPWPHSSQEALKAEKKAAAAAKKAAAADKKAA
jgi:hypothetical protein